MKPPSLCSLEHVGSILNNAQTVGIQKTIETLSAINVAQLSSQQINDILEGNEGAKLVDSMPVKIRDDPSQFVFDVIHGLYKLSLCKTNEILFSISKLYIDRYVNTVGRDSQKLSAIISNMDSYMHRLLQSCKSQNTISKNIHNELNTMLPDTLGYTKTLLVNTISKYYEYIHPIVSAQILCALFRDFHRQLPTTRQDARMLFYRTILLNSGPLILKLMQMMTRVLPQKIKETYGFHSFTYPLMDRSTVDAIMSQILIQPQYCKRISDVSASVGHVRLYKNDTPGPHSQFVVKIIKPVTNALTSCWESSLMDKMYAQDTRENRNIRLLLDAINNEFDLSKEAKNMQKGFEKYTCTYAETFDIDIDMKLTSTRPISGVLRPGIWQAVAMDVARGFPLSKVVKEPHHLNQRQFNTLYRGMDLLVQRWLFCIVGCGFYHCDLHPGNIFFSPEDRTVTLIDWGAIGYIHMFARSSIMKMMRRIIAASIYDNFERVLDMLTAELNRNEQLVDVTHSSYSKLKKKLREYKQRVKPHDVAAMHEDIFGMRQSEHADEKHRPDIYNAKDDTVSESRFDATNELWDAHRKKRGVSFADVLHEIIMYYTMHDVNIQSEIPEVIEFQRAYATLLGTLMQLNYHSFRFRIALERAVGSWKRCMHIANGDAINEFITDLHAQKREGS
jgi:hypothetical protein